MPDPRPPAVRVQNQEICRDSQSSGSAFTVAYIRPRAPLSPRRPGAVTLRGNGRPGGGSARAKSHARELPLPPAARAAATHAVPANTAGHAGFGEPSREPPATDSERRHAIPGDRICS
jgi:hypothetical protein